MGSIIQMRAVSTGGSESGLAAVDVPLNGDIVGVEWTADYQIDTAADVQSWQLSFGSTLADVNDSRQVISNFNVGRAAFTAGGTAIAGGSYYVVIPNVPVGMGERLFIHSFAAAGVVGTCRVCVQFSFDVDKAQVRRR